ncbi:MAG: VOC family protein [Proteobacteria bacterium]|nr:VOC family protein [Pseudomonadota bacterium]
MTVELPPTPSTALMGHHHITMGVGEPQEDFDFHTKVLGLKCVKRTLFYDGATPIYHFYYGNDMGEESTLVTTFPVRHIGIKATKGSGQIVRFALSVPTGSIGYWNERLKDHGFDVTETERFGETHLDFVSPHDIHITLAGVEDDTRKPHSSGPVPAENMIRGTHSIVVSSRDMEFMEEFMQVAWGCRREADEGNRVRYTMGEGGTGTYTDFEVEPDRKAGSWHVGEGAVHHMAYNCPDKETQLKIKFFVEGLGYTDFSDVKDRGYFDSIYVRTPSGALFEACVSHNPSFLMDEPAETLGTQVMMSPQIEANKEEVFKIIGTVEG